MTYISQNDISYLIDGKHGSLPNENYVVLDVSVKDLEIDNFINICWGGDYSQYLWEITIEAEVLKSTLDTSKFLFESNLPVEGPWRIPTDEKFKGPNCEIIFINDLK